MSIHVSIKIPDVSIFDIDAFEKRISAGIHQTIWDAQSFWQTIAGQRLKSSRQAYQNAIRADVLGPFSGTLYLEGPSWIGGLEFGTPGYPMNVAPGQIIPLNVNRAIIFTSPEVWRTGTGEPWKHPGFPGMNMLEDVEDHIVNELLPKYVDEAIKDLVGG